MATEQGPWLDVDLGAIQRNARRYAAAVGVRLLPMVKANAYGLGAIPVTRVLEALAPVGFGVATLSEAAVLREAGMSRPIVCFVPFVPTDRDDYVELGVRPAIADVDGLRAWLPTGRPFHLAIDTGMARGGISWRSVDELDAAASLLAPGQGFEGAYTHFHSADESAEATEVQWTRFQQALSRLGGRPPLVHAANSAAGQWGGRYAGSLARPGIFLYGGRAGNLVPEPVARLSARVVSVRTLEPGDTVSYGATFRAADRGDVVTLGIGYADGVSRALGGRGRVWLNGATHAIAGRVTMDMTMVVTPPGAARVGDRAILFGPELSIDEQAASAGTIAYELLTSVGTRVIRRYGGEA